MPQGHGDSPPLSVDKEDVGVAPPCAARADLERSRPPRPRRLFALESKGKPGHAPRPPALTPLRPLSRGAVVDTKCHCHPRPQRETPWQEATVATGHRSSCSGEERPRAATLEESGVATRDPSSLHRRQKVSGKCFQGSRGAARQGPASCIQHSSGGFFGGVSGCYPGLQFPPQEARRLREILQGVSGSYWA